MIGIGLQLQSRQPVAYTPGPGPEPVDPVIGPWVAGPNTTMTDDEGIVTSTAIAEGYNLIDRQISNLIPRAQYWIEGTVSELPPGGQIFLSGDIEHAGNDGPFGFALIDYEDEPGGFLFEAPESGEIYLRFDIYADAAESFSVLEDIHIDLVQLPIVLQIVSVGHDLSGLVAPEPLQSIFLFDEVYTQHISGASLSINWEDSSISTNMREYISENEINFLILSEDPAIENYETLETVQYIQTWRDQGFLGGGTSEVRWFWNWKEVPGFGETPDFEGWKEQTSLDAETHYVAAIEELAEEVEQHLYCIPGGEALVALVDAVENSDIADLSDPSELFIDGFLLSDPARYFMTMVWYASLTFETPVGQPFPVGMDDVTEEMAEDLQALAWEVVSNHPYAGVAEWPDPVPVDVPDAFVSEEWTASEGFEQIEVTVINLPFDGGATILDVEYRIDGGDWESFGNLVGGVLEELDNGTPYDIEIRAVNSVGPGPASDIKTRTPTGTLWLAGDNTIVTPGTPVNVAAVANEAFKCYRLITGLTPFSDYVATGTVTDTGGLSLYIVADNEPELIEGVFGFTQVVEPGPIQQEFTAPAEGEVYIGFWAGGSGMSGDMFEILEDFTVELDE